MIISGNPAPTLEEFQALLSEATDYLNQEAITRETYFMGRHAQKLEDDVIVALTECAKGGPFEGTIQKISGQKFPDIVAAKYYGVEVKTSKGTKWVSLGGSVNESTRVEGVERIFLLFGQLVAPVTFMSRAYEDCLSDVVVTHYPRYKIDMKLGGGETIFDKMETTYDDLRAGENPVREIVQYYKRNLQGGESVWWIDEQQDEDIVEHASMTIKLWETLLSKDKKELIVEGLVLFPEIIGNSSTKYGRFASRLVTKYNIVSTSIRDKFSAGGKETIVTPAGTFDKMPQVMAKINAFKDEIVAKLLDVPEEDLLECWKVETIADNRLEQWIGLVSAEGAHKISNIYNVLIFIYSE